jgi:hypothetical protein
MANPIRTEKAKYTMAGLAPGAVLAILVLQSLILLILFLGWFVGHWAWLRESFPGGLFAGSFPIVVVWAGAAGGIANAVRGLTTHWSHYIDPITSDYEREKWNAWSLAQGPLGAVYGSAGILLLVLVLGVIGSNSSGTLDLSPAGRLTVAAIAFIIGYHQQIFHDVITRTVEAIFAPRSRSADTDRQAERDRARLDIAAAPEGVYTDESAGYGSREWQDDGYGQPASDAGQQQWVDAAYSEAPAGPGTHAWQEGVPAAADAQTWAGEAPAAADAQTWAGEAPAAADAQTWAESTPAQTWSHDPDGLYAEAWAEPSATQSEQAGQGLAGVDEDPTTPVQTERPESAVDQTEAAASVTVDPGAVDPVAVEPAEKTEPVETNPVETNPVETNPVETNPIQKDAIEADAVKIDGVEHRTEEAVASEPVVPDQVTARRARTTTTRRVRRQAR